MKNSTPKNAKRQIQINLKTITSPGNSKKGGQIETNRPEKLAKLVNVNLSVPILVKPCELSPTNHENMKI